MTAKNTSNRSAHKNHDNSIKKTVVSTAKRRLRKKHIHAYPWQKDGEGLLLINRTQIERILDAVPLDYEKDTCDKMLDYLLIVKELNKDINLVSRSNVEEVLLISLFESLFASKISIWKNKDISYLDIGTGGGFPGIPIALLYPDISVTLLDSRRSKILALRRICSELKITNVRVIHDRAEILHDHEDIVYDVTTVRAVGPLKEFTPWVETLLKPGGSLLTWKGPEAKSESELLDNNKWKAIENISIVTHRGILHFQMLK